MIKQKFKKKLILILFIILNLFLTNKIFAATLSLNPSKDSLGIGEQFYVDLKLDPENESINAISGKVFFDKGIKYIRYEDGKSIINLWVEKPKQNENFINFSGLITNGFDGVIDPFSPKIKLPGVIIRLIFEVESSGSFDLSTSEFLLNLNDGLGTEVKIPPFKHKIIIEKFTRKIKYKSEEYGTPELVTYITRDPNIFNNKYTLIFKAFDKEVGIKNVKIKEGRKDWKEIESPYLLRDQSRHSKITLQATNFSGAGIIVNIDSIPYDWGYLLNMIIVIIAMLTIIIIIMIKKYVNKK